MLDIKQYRRENSRRIFVNRNLYFDRIQFIGFDMDYTLAEYKSPAYEELIYKYAVSRLVSSGYPNELEKVKYEPRFSARGLVFDRRYGNFLKVDPYGNILTAVHGLDNLPLGESRKTYPNRFVEVGDLSRYCIFNTLFELAEMFLLSSVIEYFDRKSDWKINDTNTGVEKDEMIVTYKTMFEDVHKTFDVVHRDGCMKKETLDNIDRYIKKDPRLPLLIRRMKKAGKKVFIVTNSDYWYTNGVLTYLFNNSEQAEDEMSNDWKDYFDIVVVDAMKPLFFADGTSMCQVDTVTGRKHIGTLKGKVKGGNVFAGGNSEVLAGILNAQGKDILFVGDHIFGDILKSKKKQGWRTYLVVPEMEHEINMWVCEQKMYRRIKSLEAVLSNIYMNLDSECAEMPGGAEEIRLKIRDNVINIEKTYGPLGSLLRCGSQHTFFASQVTRFADLYSHTCLNLLYYPFCYHFRAHAVLMPHEATVDTTRFAEQQQIAATNASLESRSPSLLKAFTICAEEQQTDEPIENCGDQDSPS